MDDVLHLLPTVVAVMQRVAAFKDLSIEEFERESLWQLQKVVLNCNGKILWRRFPLGRELLMCLAEAQNWRCCYCGTRMRTDVANTNHRYATLEHVEAWGNGGADHPDNLVVACFWCNNQRNNLPVEVYLSIVRPYN